MRIAGRRYRKLLGETAIEYLASKTKGHDRTIISEAQLVTVTRAMKRLREHFAEQPVSQFSGEQLLPLLLNSFPFSADSEAAWGKKLSSNGLTPSS